jgi:hypothetical protein
MGVITGFLHFCYDFVIGDCWQIAAGVAVVLIAGAAVVRAALLPLPWVGPCVMLGIVGVVLVSLLRETRRHGS